MAGTLEHRVSTSVRTNAGTVSSASYTLTGDHEYNYEVEDLAAGTDVQVDMTADVSTIVSLCIEATTAMTLETNSSSSPANTIALVANKPVVWNTQIQSTLGTACPLSVDVTNLYVTNAAVGDLKIYILFSGSV
jgi:hypothetical protein